MESIGISFGSILLAAFVFYFVIKSAVKNGINNSLLFTDEQRAAKEKQEAEEIKKLFEKNKKK
ncbi:MAG: DUF6019 family protein [Prevotellaceae bacterium]|jgi:hypothetical protein|nr:DUF6019 family protein [Prevotellaceae bacterium]